MSTFTLRRSQFGGLMLDLRTICILQNRGITPEQLRSMTIDDLILVGLDRNEAATALRVASQKAAS